MDQKALENGKHGHGVAISTGPIRLSTEIFHGGSSCCEWLDKRQIWRYGRPGVTVIHIDLLQTAMLLLERPSTRRRCGTSSGCRLFERKNLT